MENEGGVEQEKQMNQRRSMDGEESRRWSGTRKRRGDTRKTKKGEEGVRNISLCKASRFRRCVLRTDRLLKRERTTKAGGPREIDIDLASLRI